MCGKHIVNSLMPFYSISRRGAPCYAMQHIRKMFSVYIGIGVTIDSITSLKLSWSSVDDSDLQHGVDHQEGCVDLSRWMKYDKMGALESYSYILSIVYDVCIYTLCMTSKLYSYS